MLKGEFHLKSPFQPTGDQPQAIDAICEGLNAGMRYQTLLGVTGSGKTFTMANVIERMNRPTLILEPNKTLAAQLCPEYRPPADSSRSTIQRILLPHPEKTLSFPNKVGRQASYWAPRSR